VNTHSIDFRQDAIVGASAHDANDNYLTVAEQARLDTQGSGFSIGLGAIIKPSHETRIGLAFESLPGIRSQNIVPYGTMMVLLFLKTHSIII